MRSVLYIRSSGPDSLRDHLKPSSLDRKRLVNLVGGMELVHVGSRRRVEVLRDCAENVLEAAASRERKRCQRGSQAGTLGASVDRTFR